VVRVPLYTSKGPRFDSRRYQIFWEVVDLERSPLSLVSTNEELLRSNSSDSGLQSRKYGRGDSLRWPRDTSYPQKLALTSPTSGGRLVGRARSRTEATGFSLKFKFIATTFLSLSRSYEGGITLNFTITLISNVSAAKMTVLLILRSLKLQIYCRF
jgi:hypothetical protein